MFLGSIIYNKRREMNLTQVELAQDVCTQNTISKIEKHNVAPTVNILIKICLRLDLTLNDVFSEFSSKANNQENILDKIEEKALLKDIDGLDKEIDSLRSKLSNDDWKQYELINGVLDFWKNNIETSMFTFDKVLQYTKSDETDVYTLLAYLFKGLRYSNQGFADQASYYFKMITAAFEEEKDIDNASDLEILFIYKMIAQSFDEMKLYDDAYQLSQEGLDFAQERNVSYFLDELNYSAALALQNGVNHKQAYEDHYNLAYYLAKLNDNKSLMHDIKNMQNIG
ncbi:helix-turn-helix domain-containing protein [Companilactobacillus halodurans]|uniref:helix-turn-helix domain-containing protein n=1 Tax=Companilactobacillus halodurans TaxID=2584183 RepID=UPI001865052A|nr:helix-turn-helix transcriptional regulator [Companilactobacillus halodurans]